MNPVRNNVPEIRAEARQARAKAEPEPNRDGPDRARLGLTEPGVSTTRIASAELSLGQDRPSQTEPNLVRAEPEPIRSQDSPAFFIDSGMYVAT